MSALRMAATTLWTQLIDAMRADGIIAQCITQSGPATNAVITDAATKALHGPWLSMGIVPAAPNRQVVAVSESGGLFVVWYDHVEQEWVHSSDGSIVGDAIVAYTFIDTSGVPK